MATIMEDVAKELVRQRDTVMASLLLAHVEDLRALARRAQT